MREPLRDFLFGDRESLQDRETLATQIDAELHDHLESIAERLRHQGLTPDAAQTQAQQIFGPVEPIRRSCLWIQQGDLIMYRALAITGIGILALGLIGLVFVGLQIQESIATSTAQFQAMMTELRTSAPPQAPARDRGTISGRVYLGTPDRPAAAADLRIVCMDDGQIVRRCTSDASGHFQFENMQLGDYSVLARLIGTGNEPFDAESGARYCIQSVPQILSATAPDSQVALDVQLPLVDMRLELEPSVPEWIEVGNRKVYLQTYVALIHPELVRLPWTPATSKAATAWPVIGWDEKNTSTYVGGQFGLIPEAGSASDAGGNGVLLIGKNRETREKHATWPPQNISRIFRAGTYRAAAVTLAYLFSEDDLASQLAFGRGGSPETATFSQKISMELFVAKLSAGVYIKRQWIPLDPGGEFPFRSPNGWCSMTRNIGFGGGGDDAFGKFREGNDGVDGPTNIQNQTEILVYLYQSTLPFTDFTADSNTRVTIGVQPPAEWIAGIREALAKPDITAEEMGKALEIQRCQCTARAEPIR